MFAAQRFVHFDRQEFARALVHDAQLLERPVSGSSPERMTYSPVSAPRPILIHNLHRSHPDYSNRFSRLLVQADRPTWRIGIGKRWSESGTGECRAHGLTGLL